MESCCIVFAISFLLIWKWTKLDWTESNWGICANSQNLLLTHRLNSRPWPYYVKHKAGCKKSWLFSAHFVFHPQAAPTLRFGNHCRSGEWLLNLFFCNLSLPYPEATCWLDGIVFGSVWDTITVSHSHCQGWVRTPVGYFECRPQNTKRTS